MPSDQYDDHSVGGSPSIDRHARLLQQASLILGRDGSGGIPGVVAIPAVAGLDDRGEPRNWRDPEVGLGYLARDGYVLVRDADLGRVSEALPGGGPVDARDGNVNGLTLFWYDIEQLRGRLADLNLAASVDGVCRYLDGRLGAGVATPDHLLYLSSTGGTCPATEPEPVFTPTRPYPQPPRAAADGAGVMVWVLDSGLLDDAEAAHPWLKEVTGDTDDPYRPATTDILPYAGHGTFCAGVLRTMAPGARVHVAKTFVRVYDRVHSQGTFETKDGVFESDLAEFATRGVRAGAQILSLAFGTHSRDNHALLGISALKPLIDDYPGVVIVAAAGNEATSEYFWPAAFDWVVSVGALSRSWDERAWFTNFGPWVKVYAPGEDLVNAFVSLGTFTCIETPNGGQTRQFFGMARWSGTSFATPMVAGLIACRMSHTGQTAVEAAAALLAEAPVLPGVGRVLLPGSCRHCGCGGRCDCRCACSSEGERSCGCKPRGC